MVGDPAFRPFSAPKPEEGASNKNVGNVSAADMALIYKTEPDVVLQELLKPTPNGVVQDLLKRYDWGAIKQAAERLIRMKGKLGMLEASDPAAFEIVFADMAQEAELDPSEPDAVGGKGEAAIRR